MTRTDGEHELVLGNKQLLSAFFVVVILLGVFFTMGYFVGKNTATAGFNAGQSASGGGTRPDAPGKPLDAGPAAASLPPDNTSPAVDSDAMAAAPPDTKSDAKPAPPPSQNDFLPAQSEAMAQPSSAEMYLQISAIRRPDADNMVKVLRERGFPALLGESSKQGLYRVLVGPFKTNVEMGRAKTDLKAKGFDSIVAK